MSIVTLARRASAAGLASLALVGAAQAQFTLSKVFVNPPGTDNGQEVIEIRGAASSALTGYSLLVVEGDGSGAGTLDVVYSLDAAVTGANGILLVRDSAAVISPAPDPLTSVFLGGDFNPDLENGSNTFILGFGTPPAQGTDLDTDNDGTLDVSLAAAGFTVVDAIGFVENDGASNVAYADDLGFANFGPFPGFNADVLIRVYNELDGTVCNLVGCDVIGTNPGGPYTVDFPRAEGFAAHNLAAPAVIPIAFGSVMPEFDLDGDGLANACDPADTYCTAGTSLIGCVPSLSASGVPSASASSGYVLSLSGAQGDRAVQFFYSATGPDATPFGAGLLCIAAPRQRMGAIDNSGGDVALCNGSATRDLQQYITSFPGAIAAPLTAGTTLYFQATVRDPGNTKNRVMSDALVVTIVP